MGARTRSIWDRMRALVNGVMNLWVPQNTGNFLRSLGRVSFSGRNLLHAVSRHQGETDRARPILDPGARTRWVSSATSHPLYPRRRQPVPTAQAAPEKIRYRKSRLTNQSGVTLKNK
jgi:hypothetical protein